MMAGRKDSSSEGQFSRDGEKLDVRRRSGADLSHESS